MKKAIITKEELLSLESALNMIHKEHLLINLLEKKGLTAIKVGRLRKVLVGKVTRSTLEDGSIEFIQTHEHRQSGKTSKQMLDCVGGSLYFWPHIRSLDYAIELANDLGRTDLQIYCVSDLRYSDNFRGREINGIEIDHASWELIGERERGTIRSIQARLGRETP